MSKTVAEVVVETLQAAGVKHCWGVPGDTLNYFTDAIRRSGIDWVHVRHEEVGGFAARAEALLTDTLTACAGSCTAGRARRGPRGWVRDWLSQPGPALLDVVVSRLEPVMPSHIEPGQVFGTALYSAKALLGGRAGDVWDLALDNL